MVLKMDLDSRGCTYGRHRVVQNRAEFVVKIFCNWHTFGAGLYNILRRKNLLPFFLGLLCTLCSYARRVTACRSCTTTYVQRAARASYAALCLAPTWCCLDLDLAICMTTTFKRRGVSLQFRQFA